MLCNQQWHQLRYLTVALARLRTTGLGGSVDLLFPPKSSRATIVFGSKTREFNDVPVASETRAQTGSTQRWLFGCTRRMVSFTLRNIFGRQHHCRSRWIRCAIEHHIELCAKESTSRRIDDNRNHNGIECSEFETGEEATSADATATSFLVVAQRHRVHEQRDQWAEWRYAFARCEYAEAIQRHSDSTVPHFNELSSVTVLCFVWCMCVRLILP